MIPVGLDIGTGFTKISALGKTISIPSLYSCLYTTGSNIEDIHKKKTLVEKVGKAAIKISRSSDAILIRPVKFGVPYDDKGFAALAREGLKQVGILDSTDAWITAGVTFEAKEQIKIIKKIIQSTLKPRGCAILPQAFGTLTCMKEKYGTVINIGHGTTEIMKIGIDGIKGTSIAKASDFVTSQLTKKHQKDAYVNFKKLFEENDIMTQRLVGLLAKHIADEVSRINPTKKIILAGGGANLPTMKEELEKILGIVLVVPDDPIFSNAIGFEDISRKEMNTSIRPEQIKSDIDIDQQGVDKAST